MEELKSLITEWSDKSKEELEAEQQALSHSLYDLWRCNEE